MNMKNFILECQRLVMRLLKMLEEKRGVSGQIYFQHRVPEYREMWRSVAQDVGAVFHALSEDLWELEFGGRTIRINNHQLEFDNPVTLGLAGNKPLVHQLLHKRGIAVPEFLVFQFPGLANAYQFLSRYPRGCVIKPVAGYGGKGVTTHIRSEKECRKAAILASVYSRELLMEPQVAGESYRLLVIEGKVVHAVRRSGLRIYGDGRHTVSELIAQENTRRRIQGIETLENDPDFQFCMAVQSLSLDAVLENGASALIRVANKTCRKRVEVRTVYDQAVTALLCDAIKKDAELAAEIVRSEFLGVDVITMDPSVPLRESGGVINEVNTTPALHHHYKIDEEPYPRVALTAMSALLMKRFAGTESRQGQLEILSRWNSKGCSS